MSLSRLYTAQEVWVEAVRDLDRQEVESIPHWEKFRIINRAVISIIGQFFDLVANDYMTSVNPTLAGDAFSIATYNIMRVGHAIKCVITSTTAPYVESMSLDKFSRWRTNAPQNRAKIVWTLTGDTIQLKKPAALSYGTVTFWYPKTPTEVTADGDFVDIPDGMPIDLLILKVKEILTQRLGLPEQNKTQEITAKIQQMYETFGKEPEMQLTPEKVLAQT